MSNIIVKINCTQNDRGAWCKDKRIKRSIWGIGARCCIEYDDKICDIKQPTKRPKINGPHSSSKSRKS